jgi:DNA-binding NtrC family response regulator
VYPTQPEVQIHQTENSTTLTKPSLLIVEKDQAVRELLKECLFLQYNCAMVVSADAAKAQLQNHRFHLVVTEMSFPELSGLHLCDYIHKHHPRTAVVAMASCENRALRLAAWRHGAFFLCKPFDLPHLESIVALALHFGGSSGKSWTDSFFSN